MRIDKIIKVAKKRGLGGIAITDHNSIKGGINALKLKHPDFFVICGSEICTEKGDLIGLFLTEAIRSKKAIEVIDEIKSQDGISLLAHPYKRCFKIDEAFLKEVDGVEAFNARATIFENKMAQNIASKCHMVTGGSDAHFYFEIGRGATVIKSADDIEEIRKKLLQREVILDGMISCPYVETLSQLVSFSKTRKLDVLFSNVLLKTAFTPYKFMRGKKSKNECTYH